MNGDYIKYRSRYYTRLEIAIKILTSPEWLRGTAPVELLRDYRGHDILRVRKGTAELCLTQFDDIQGAWAAIQEALARRKSRVTHKPQAPYNDS